MLNEKELIDFLERKADEFYKNEECSLSRSRELALEFAKKQGLIKDYRYTTNRTDKGIFFGSCVGFDKMYRVFV